MILSPNRRHCSLLEYTVRAAVIIFVTVSTAWSAAVETSLTPLQARVGDLLQLELKVEDAGDAIIEWPPFHLDTLAFQLVSVDSQGMLPQERIFNLALYDTGNYLLPPLPIVLHAANSTETLFTHHCKVEIASVLPDTASVPRPIKGLRSLPITWRDLLAWTPWLLMAALAVATFFLYRKYRRKRQPEVFKAPERVRPVHELAISELIELRDKKLPQRGMLKEFYSELSEILRRYVERRYGFPALEMTTWDIEQKLSTNGYAQILFEEGLIILRESDLVKFAKYLPSWQSCDKHLERAFRIIEATKETVESTIGEAA